MSGGNLQWQRPNDSIPPETVCDLKCIVSDSNTSPFFWDTGIVDMLLETDVEDQAIDSDLATDWIPEIINFNHSGWFCDAHDAHAIPSSQTYPASSKGGLYLTATRINTARYGYILQDPMRKSSSLLQAP